VSADKTWPRVVVVTGGGVGLGKEIARAFVATESRVVLCGRTQSALDEAASELATFEGPVEGRTCDVSKDDDVVALVEGVMADYGRIDVLVNNAGVYGPVGLVLENDPAEWLQAMQINLGGVFLMTRRVAPHMVAGGGGCIINLSGGGGTAPKPRYSSYASSKSGVIRLTENTAVELAEHGVRVNAIAPGFIATRIHDETLKAGERAGSDLETVKKKLAEGGDDPQKAADLAVFLASDEAEGITGKLFSAIWDDWKSDEARATLRDSSHLYTLRRIDDFMFKEVPKE
jgi:NAD(P)-dependent dehydrogenase (short-subunit alcohol dehydrogenase family)